MLNIFILNKEVKCLRMMISTSKENVIQTANRIRPKLTNDLKLTARPILRYLVDNYGVNIMTYKEVERDYNISSFQLNQLTQSNDAVSYYLPSTQQFHLLYNSDVSTKARKIWSIYHEAGHIIREHQLACPDSSKDERKLMEWEANTFTREILAPTTLVLGAISKYRKDSATFQDLYFMYRHLFGLSKQAASLASSKVYRETPTINQDLLNFYSNQLRDIFPYIKTRSDYEQVISCITKSEYDVFKSARDLLGAWAPIGRTYMLSKI